MNLHCREDSDRKTAQVKNAVPERLRKALGAAPVSLTASMRRHYAKFARKVREARDSGGRRRTIRGYRSKHQRSMLQVRNLDKSFQPRQNLFAKANGPYKVVWATLRTLTVEKD